jgi:hypothetical protein
MDANAHNIIWGSSDTNPRGENLIEYLAGNHLVIINKGKEPTFSNGRRSEVIDTTVGKLILKESLFR